jgi:cysteinyl-tRNA synthetase
MTSLCEVLGIKAIKKDELLDEEIEGLIKERQEARKQKDFKKSDEIRDLLLEKGIVLEDTREGVRWKRA